MGSGITLVNDQNSLQAFVDWANSARPDQVAGMKGNGLGDIKKVSTGFQRCFKKATVEAMKNTAVDRFKAALAHAYGDTLANQAWETACIGRFIDAVGENGPERLTAELVREACDTAQRLGEKFKEESLEANGNDLAAYYDEINESKMNAEQRESFKDDMKRLALERRIDSLLCMTPSTKAESALFTYRVAFLTSTLDKAILLSREKNETDVVKRMVELKEAVQNKLMEVLNYKKDLPDGDNALGRLANHWKKSLDEACCQLLTAYSGHAPLAYKKLNDKIKALKTKYSEVKMLSMLRSKKKDIGAVLQSELAKCVSSAGVPKNVIKVSGLLNDCHLKVLNSTKWKTIEKKFSGLVGGKKMTFDSTITPGLNIHDSFESDYGNGFFGFSCQTTNTPNAVNLATSELKVGKETVFSGVRHAVHNAKNVNGKTNEEANKQRAMQTVKAACCEYFKRNKDAVKALVNASVPITFDMLSISLLSPKGSSEDKKMLAAQNKALEEFDGETEVEIEMDGVKCKFKPKIQTFNFGDTSRLNMGKLEKILTSAHNYLNNPYAVDHTKRAVEQLLLQINHIKMGVERKNNEVYMLESRVAVLAYLIGEVPVWNCKSGNDRTGRMDAECKFLAALIDGHSKEKGTDHKIALPFPGAPLTHEQQQLFNQILLQSGNRELQDYNMGVAKEMENEKEEVNDVH